MIGSHAWALLGLFSLTALAAPRPVLPPRPNFLQNYPPQLKEQGQKLHHFLLRLEKNRPIPPKESAALATMLAQSKEFAPFAWGPKLWHELTKKQLSFADVGPLCQEDFLAGQTDFLHPVNNTFYQQIEQRCQDLFLAYLKTFPATLAQYEQQYLIHLLPILLNQHTDFLAAFMAQSKNATFYPTLKATMREEIISRKIPFPPTLQEVLDIPYAMDYSSNYSENYAAYNIDAYHHLQELYQSFREELPHKDAPALARKTQELLTYCNQYQAQLPPNFRWVTLISTGKRLLAHQHHGAAIEAFTLASHAAKEEQRQEAIFYLILTYLHQQDAAAALKVIEQNNFLTDYVQLNSKYQFWVALTLERSGQTAKALQLFQNLIA
ncbi:MAG: hypothetical protein J6Y94_02340, partial [Bacteriovoracaceae bacterium]|nr:hypothetical protein [Bacteriovoracaceae bacterium]